MKRSLSLLFLALLTLMTEAASATTWYVRPDGGTRYSSVMTGGQCNGQADAPYPGQGTNQACAFNDFRFLYQDGSYASSDGTSNFAAPHWGWVIAGGDTVLLRGSLGTGVSYRVGWNNPSDSWDEATGLRWGLSGDPYGSGPPAIPAGTAAQPTRILGENHGACTAASAKTQLHGGYALGTVLNMADTSYVDVECLDITDFSNCGLSNQQSTCNKDIGSLSDFAGTGVYWDNASSHVTMSDVHVHGLAKNGMQGPTGDGTVLTRVDIIGNASSGWNTDNGTVGVGSLLVQNYNISWNGCAEEYPIVDALPYQDCTDDSNGGYGDGFGTATVFSTTPWNVHFDQGVVSYNTQDGLDALHLVGSGSSMSITRTLAYGNMGEQLKSGGSNGTIENSVIVGNCYAMQNAIPGTPAGFNAHLSDFCRAGNNGVLISTEKNATTAFRFNTLYSPNAVGVLLQCDQTQGPCDSTSRADVRNNVFVGFVSPYQADFPAPLYLDNFPSGVNPFSNPGSFNSNNVTYHAKANWTCPALWLNETNALCSDPSLTDETQRAYGFNNAAPLQGSEVIGTGVTIPGLTLDFTGAQRVQPTSRGAIDPGLVGTTAPTAPPAPISAPTAPAPSSPTTPTTTTTTTTTTGTKSLGPAPSVPTATAAATQITLSLSKGPSSAKPVVLTATVTAALAGKIPVGNVVVYTNGNWPLVLGTINKTGTISWTIPAGLTNLTIYGAFTGSSNFKASVSPMLVEQTAIAALH